MKLEPLLKELEKEYQLKKPFDQIARGVFVIPLDDDIQLYISQNNDGILFNATLIEAPIGKEEELYMTLLHANLMGQGTKGALLALTDDARKLTLSRLIEYDPSFNDFKDMLDDFIDSVDFWCEEALIYQQ